MDRRELMKVVASAATLLSLPAGCRQSTKKPVVHPPSTWSAIDAHCHIFNAKDVPAVRFIKVVMLHVYPREVGKVLNIDDPDVIDGMVMMFLWLAQATRAPSADAESKVLMRQQRPRPENSIRFNNDEAVVNALASFVANNDISVANDADSRKLGKIRSSVLAAAGESDVGVSDQSLTSEEAHAVAARAYRSKYDLGQLLRWFGLFTRYRFSLADQLADDFLQQGIKPALLCPALVDYDYWLEQYLDDGSTLREQVAVMGRISRRVEGAVVHGYVGFDPLRQVAYDLEKFKAFSPLGLVRHAVESEGFIGVKLYPPMGFRAFGNGSSCQSYSDIAFIESVAGIQTNPLTACTPPADRYEKVGNRLDDALARLYDYCEQSGACIIAHANNSNGANRDYGKRADPAYWLPVFGRWPELRVLLAHFGSFTSISAASAQSVMPEASWEWAFGEYVQRNPQAPVFTDFSFLVEIFGKTPEALESYAEWVASWIAEFDPDCHHLVFGTDWLMLGANPNYPHYASSVREFFESRIGLDATRLKRVFFDNAARFIGLREGDQTRIRLEKFYLENGIPFERLPKFAG